MIKIKDILSMSLAEIQEEAENLGLPKFRAKQIFQWLHIKRVTDFDQMSNLSKELREVLKENYEIKKIFPEKILKSKLDETAKILYKLEDNEYIETVLMKYKYGYSICVSSQVGCKMGCKFCASTLAGYVRNLSPSEILQQIYLTESQFGVKISNVVMMGIGEPLDNYQNVIKFLKLLSDKDGNNLSLRNVSLSTCGVVNRIYDLAEEKFGLTLSISLHAANDETRSKLMPINTKFNIAELLSACKHYIKKTGRRISFEYAIIKDVNDNRQTALELAKLLKGMLCHVNLIPVNYVLETGFKTSEKNKIYEFQKVLTDNNINATIRRTLGSDIKAACGQLRRDQKEVIQ